MGDRGRLKTSCEIGRPTVDDGCGSRSRWVAARARERRKWQVVPKGGWKEALG